MLTSRAESSFFVAAFALSWVVWIGILLSGQTVFSPNDPLSANATGVALFVLLLLGGFGPSVAGLVFARREGGAEAFRALLKSGFSVRMPARAYALALLLPFAVAGAAWALHGLVATPLTSDLLAMPFLVVPTFVTIFLMGGALNEEFGWRGYALPRLEARYGPLRANLLLGVLWAFWHLPLFFIAGTGQHGVSLWLYVPLVVSYSLVFGVLHRLSHGRVFAALLLHAAINTSAGAFALFADPAALAIYLGLNVAVAMICVPFLRAPANPTVTAGWTRRAEG